MISKISDILIELKNKKAFFIRSFIQFIKQKESINIIKDPKNIFNAFDNFQSKKKLKYIFVIGLLNFFASAPIGFIWILFISFPIFFSSLNQSINNKNFKEFCLKIVCFIGGFSISQFNWLVVPLFTELKFLILTPFALLLAPFILTIINLFVFLPFYFVSLLLINKQNENKDTNIFIKIYNESLFLKVILFSICYIAGEYIRGEYLFGGFQWQIFGNLFSNLFFIQILKYCNIYIYSFVYLLICFVVFLLYNKSSKNLDKKFSFFLLALFVGIISYSIITLILNPKKDESQKMNFIAGVQNNLSAGTLNRETRYQKITRVFADMQILGQMPKDSLLIMPEASFEIINDNYLQFLKILSNEIKQQDNLFISGVIFVDRQINKVYNSILFADAGGNLIGRYNKQKLVPFGEYIPARKYIPKFLQPITGQADFSSNGKNDDVILYRNFPLMFPFVCYEIIFSEHVKKRLDKIKSKNYFNKEKLIINLTNDIWTGRSISAYQHFRMARMTAVRANANLVRLSNNGISAIIDNNGRILYETPINEKAVLLSKI